LWYTVAVPSPMMAFPSKPIGERVGEAVGGDISIMLISSTKRSSPASPPLICTRTRSALATAPSKLAKPWMRAHPPSDAAGDSEA